MGNSNKVGLDYFSFDVDFFEDVKIRFVKARFGKNGEAMLIRLMCKVYRQGFFLYFGDDEQQLFAAEVSERISVVKDLIEECLKRGFFSNEVFQHSSVLTSKGIQQRYFEASKRRSKITISEEEESYLVINELPENVYINRKNVNINSIDVHINSQSKVNRKEIEIEIESKSISAQAEKQDIYPFIFNLSFYKEMAKELSVDVDSISKFSDKFRKELILKKDLNRNMESITRYFVNAYQKGRRGFNYKNSTPENEIERLPDESLYDWNKRVQNAKLKNNDNSQLKPERETV